MADSHVRRPPVGAVVLLIAAVQALMVAMFTWAPAETGPRDLPIVVAGPQQVTEGIAARLAAVPGADDGTQAFDVSRVDDVAAAEDALRDRDAYAAVTVSPGGPELLVASAASPTAAQLIQQGLAEALGPDQLAVRDVVPTTDDDPRGTGLATGLLPLVITSIAAGAAAFLFARSARARAGAVVGFAVVAGLAATAVLQFGFGIIDGSYLANAAVVGTLTLAVSAAVAGLAAVIGPAGIGLAVLVVMFFGVPFSGLASAPELLPQPWGAIGQWVPPGAGGTLLRAVAFFDGAASAGPWTALALWSAAGLGLIALGARRRQQPQDHQQLRDDREALPERQAG